MDYRKFVEKQTGETAVTFSYSFPLTKEHVHAQAGTLRKFFSNKAVKQDMDDFVEWQLTGYAEMNDDAMRACFENGASKELIDADKLAKIVAGCTTEISDVTLDLMKANGITMDELHNSMTKDFERYNQDTIIHCANIGMPHKLISKLYTEDNYLDTLIACEFSKEHIKDYMINNRYSPFTEPKSDNDFIPFDESSSEHADRLLNYGFTANELIDLFPKPLIALNDPRNCLTMLELGATAEHIAENLYCPSNYFPLIQTPNETIQILVDNGVAAETLTDRFIGKSLDNFCEQLETMGIEPKFSEQAINRFDYTEFNNGQPISQRLFAIVETRESFSEERKGNFLAAAFKQHDNESIDFLVSKGAQIDDNMVKSVLNHITDYWGNTVNLEKSAAKVIENLTIKHKYPIPKDFEQVIEKYEALEGLNLATIRGTVNKMQFHQKLEQRLPPKELTERPIPVAKKRQGQTWKI